jgi:pyruvate dehydrogenase E1 component beta subunit
MVLEALRSADRMEGDGISAEVVDLRTLKPWDEALILESVRKTGRVIVADTGWKTGGFGAEIVARVVEEALGSLKSAPSRVALPDCPTPTSPGLSRHYYPRAIDIVAAARKMLGLSAEGSLLEEESPIPLDVPDMTFTGPF